MEQADRDLLLNIVDNNTDVRKLYDEHRKLEKRVETFGRYAAYSSFAALKQKALKKEKLRGMDTIMAILKEHKCETS